MIDDDIFICLDCWEKWWGEEAIWVYGVPLCPNCGVELDSADWWEEDDEDDLD